MMTLKKTHMRNIALLCLLFMFCGHAFCYANLSFSGASVLVHVSSANRSLIESGQFLATMYWDLRGALSAPMIVGLLSCVYLAAAALLIADALSVTHPLSLISICGALALNVSVIAINAAMLHMADLYFLALLFAALGAWLCLRHPLGFIPAAACFASCPALQPSLFAAGPILLLAAFLLGLLRSKSLRGQLVSLLKAAVSLAVGFALYFAGAKLFAWRWGVSLLPLFENSAQSERYVLYLLIACGFALLDVLFAKMARRVARVLRVAVCSLACILFVKCIVFSNQVYLKKNLEYQTTLSVMTRVIEQAEQIEGFDPGMTPVAIIGTLEDSAIAMTHKGFEHLAVLDAAANNYTVSTQDQLQWYFWEIMGYPFNFVSDAQRDTLADTEAVRSMPAFPRTGYCTMQDGVMVIKLSDVQ